MGVEELQVQMVHHKNMVGLLYVVIGFLGCILGTLLCISFNVYRIASHQ